MRKVGEFLEQLKDLKEGNTQSNEAVFLTRASVSESEM
jgi:hypothetical protein